MKWYTNIDMQNIALLTGAILDGIPGAAGGIGFSGSNALIHDGTSVQYIATQSYVQNNSGDLNADELAWKKAVTVATDSVGDPSLMSVGDVIDGHTIADGDSVLIFNAEGNQHVCGVWVVSGDGNLRLADINSSAEFNGAVLRVIRGSSHGGKIYKCDTVDPVVDTDAIAFSELAPGSASTTTEGVVELATQTEAQQGTSTNKAVTPKATECFARCVVADISGTSGSIDMTTLDFTADTKAAVVQFYEDDATDISLATLDITLKTNAIDWSSATSVTGELHIFVPVSRETWSGV